MKEWLGIISLSNKFNISFVGSNFCHKKFCGTLWCVDIMKLNQPQIFMYAIICDCTIRDNECVKIIYTKSAYYVRGCHVCCNVWND